MIQTHPLVVHSASRRCGLSLVLLLVSCAPAAKPSSRLHTEMDPTECVVYGVVRAEQTGRPVAHASVVVENTRSGAQTDVRGRYRIQDLAPGQYTVRAQHPAYEYEERRDVSLEMEGYLITNRNDPSAPAVHHCEGEELNFYMRNNSVF